MPEGPEVRTVSDKIQYLTDCEISAVYINKPDYIRSQRQIQVPCIIKSIYSVGKKLVFYTEDNDGDDQYIIYSFGMTGRIQYEKSKHAHVSFEFNGFMLYFVDSRTFGGIEVFDEKNYNKAIGKLGPDILAYEVDSETWIRIFRKKNRTKIDEVLLDQAVVSGIGNYLKSEILYHSGISPYRIVKNISDEELETLRYHSHRIINESYNAGGFTIKDFISPDNSYGMFQPTVYGKKYDPENYQIMTTGKARNTFYVPEKQF